jgi:hypothetical protein
MTLLSPLGLLLALAAVLPVAAWVSGERRTDRVRAELGLVPPDARSRWRVAAVAAVPLLLALACAQPALTREQERRVRTDAAAFVVVDVSRSMQATAAPGAPTRLERARALAVRIRDGLRDTPVGLATLTDRVVPLLFPSPDPATFAQAATRALASESPPPREVATVASSLAALGEAAGANLFLPTDRRRVFVVLTDGESRPFEEAETARALRAARVALVTVHVHADDERVFRASGVPELNYRPDPGSAATLETLAAAAGGAATGESAEAAVAAARDALGSGPTRAVGTEERLLPLAPWVALAALVPLGLLLLPPLGAKPLLRRRPATIDAA